MIKHLKLFFAIYVNFYLGYNQNRVQDYMQNSFIENDELKNQIQKYFEDKYKNQDILVFYKKYAANIDNHLKGLNAEQFYEFIDKYLSLDELSFENILDIHNFLYGQEDKKNAGKLRDKAAFLTSIFLVFTPPDKIKNELDSMLNNMKINKGKFHPIEYAAFVHLNFVFIHPFFDGNGRVARFLLNLFLIKEGYCPISVAEYRQKYYNTLHGFWSGDKTAFVNFVQELVLESQKKFLDNLKKIHYN